ncbi:hypothetical protein IKG54_01850 [Candidatus Saccharibacteria bacterium]|nr:hypothetical protein [Candidatus Saccharibacteria bacterium]
MLNLTINEIGHKLADIYFDTTGETIACALSAPVHEYNEEEIEMLKSDDEDTVSLMFTKKGTFKYVGFKGEWYKTVIAPLKKDFEMVFSSENLQSLDLIEEVGRTSDGYWLAVMNSWR